MARQVINTGSALADRTGDNGRVAFTKVNENFAELYTNHTITAAETAAGLTANDLNNGYPPGDIRRYGTNTTPGTTDMTAAIEAAQAQYDEGGAPVVFHSGETYLHTPLSFSGEDIDWRSDGNEPATLYCATSPASYMATFAGSEIGTTTVSAAAYPMDMEITLTSVSDVAVGDLLKLRNSTLWQSDNRGVTYEGQLAKVVAISGSVVQLDAALAVSMPIAADVTIYRPIRVRLRGIRFERLAFDGSGRGVLVQSADEPLIENCDGWNSSRYNLHLSRCYGAKVRGGNYRGANLVISEQLGYGVLCEEAWANEVRGATFKSNRRDVDIGGGADIPSWYCVVADNQFYGGGLAEDGSDLWPLGASPSGGSGSHGAASGSVFESNLLVNCYYGFTIRGRNETIRNNLFVGAMLSPIWSHHGAGLVIENNRYTDQYEEGIATPGTTVGAISETLRPDQFLFFNPDTYDTDSYLQVSGNTVRNVKTALIHTEGAGTTEDLNNWLVYDNVVVIEKAAAGQVGIIDVEDAVVVTNLRAWNNEVIAPDDFTVLKYSITYAPGGSVAKVYQLGQNVYRLYLPDDTAARVRCGFIAGQLSAKLFPYSQNGTPRFNGIIRYESTTTVDWGGSSGVTAVATAMTGTTGVDGNTSISFDDDSVYVENRSGGALQLVLVLEGAA